MSRSPSILTTKEKARFIEQCCQVVELRKGRMTQSRRSLFEVLSSVTAPASVADLSSLLRKRSIAVDNVTLYRNIELLQEFGLIHESKNSKWLPCSHLSSQCGTVHCIQECLSCGRVEESCLSQKEWNQSQTSRTSGFLVQSVVMSGVCRRCQKLSL